MDEQNYIIDMRNIDKGYFLGTEKVPVLKQINFQVKKGEFVAILGPSGSGKTTLMNMIGCMDVCDSGEYYLEGQPIHLMAEKEMAAVRNKEIGFIFQNYQLIPTYDILQNIIMPLIVRGMTTEEAQKACMPVIEMLGISHRLKHKPSELSGGQKQRVSIAGVLAMHPKCIILDEPTAMLDPNGRKEVIRAVRALNDVEGITVILITHYMEEVIHADHVYVMDRGSVKMQGTPREIFSQVEKLKELRLSVPQVTLLAYELKKAGVPLPDGILETEELIRELKKVQ